jgi:hypothetical protein
MSMSSSLSSSLSNSLWTSFSSLVIFIIIIWGQELGIQFLHFPLNYLLNCRFLKDGIPLPSSPHASILCCAPMLLIG